MLGVRQSDTVQTDEELVRLYQAGQDGHFLGILFKRHIHEVLGNCLYFLKNQQDGEDACMEVFEQVSSTLKKNAPPGHFRNWLFIVTKNHCLKRLKKRVKERVEDFSKINEDLFVENDTSEDLLMEKRIENLAHAIEELKEDQKRCIVLFYLQNKTYKEIEALTSFSLNQVKSFIQNGKRNLKTKLS